MAAPLGRRIFLPPIGHRGSRADLRRICPNTLAQMRGDEDPGRGPVRGVGRDGSETARPRAHPHPISFGRRFPSSPSS